MAKLSDRLADKWNVAAEIDEIGSRGLGLRLRYCRVAPTDKREVVIALPGQLRSPVEIASANAVRMSDCGLRAAEEPGMRPRWRRKAGEQDLFRSGVDFLETYWRQSPGES